MDLLTKFIGNENLISILFSVASSGYYLYNVYSNYLSDKFSSKTQKIILFGIIGTVIGIFGYFAYQYYLYEEQQSNIQKDEFTDFIDKIYGNNNDDMTSLIQNMSGGDNSMTSLVKKEFMNGFMDGVKSGDKKNKDLTFIQNLDKEDKEFYLGKEMELHDYINNDNTITPKYKVLSLNLPLEIKQQVLKKIENMHNSLNPFAERDQKWVESFLKIPFDKYTNLPVSNIEDKTETTQFFKKLKEALDSDIYGQEKTKIKIYELMAQWISNPNGVPPVIGLCGPPGIGKTSLIRNLSKVLNRPFAFINMGGLKDGSELKGHSQTYVGSVWGRFIQILMEKQKMDPCIFMDELDKISELNKNEISGVLMHIIDSSQNTTFNDSYFHGINIDLSKCIFIFSFNDKNLVNRILLDRMTIIEMGGYLMEDKKNIVTKYSLPNILKNVGLEKDSVSITNEAIEYLITDKCRSEVGMRDLIHKLEDIVGKINLCKLLNYDDNTEKENLVIEELQNVFKNLEFPIEINKNLINQILT
jgi:ATP-dependent Lon protease